MIRTVPRAAQPAALPPQTPADLDALAADYDRLEIAHMMGGRLTFGAYADLSASARAILHDAAELRLAYRAEYDQALARWQARPLVVAGFPILLN